MRIREITRDAVYDWLLRQADKGLAYNYVLSQLMKLRQVVGIANHSERPDDFPWLDLLPINSANPKRLPNKPDLWGGEPGSSEPLLPLGSVNQLAGGFQAAFRPAVYLEALAGLRIGECFGLQLENFGWSDGFLWVHVVRQLDDQNVLNPWTKTDASYRRIPLAPILAEYLQEYCWQYHGCELGYVPSEKADRQFIVNPAGRDFDCTFLAARRTNYQSRFSAVRDEVGLSHETLGYLLDPQHLRKGLSTYLLNALEIVRCIDNADMGEEPSNPDELIAYLRRRLEVRPDQLVQFSGMIISRYLGHDVDKGDDPMAASPVTLEFYNLEVNSVASFISVARTIDRIARFEMGELLTTQDDEDLLPVHLPSDAQWMTCEEATSVIGITASSVWMAVKKGRLEGNLGWLADGGYKRNTEPGDSTPANPRLFVSRTSAKEMASIRGCPSLKEVARGLGMDVKTVERNFVETGRLPRLGTGHVVRIDPDAVRRLKREIYDAVLECVPPSGSVDVKALSARFNSEYGTFFVEGRANDRWVVRWVEGWAADLVALGKLSMRRGRFQRT